LLARLIEARFAGGRAELLGHWGTEQGGPSPSTLERWLKGEVPKSDRQLLRLASLLDVDVFALFAVADGTTSALVGRLLEGARRARWDRFRFFASFFQRQRDWPPPDFALEHYARPWTTRRFRHDPAVRMNFYAVLPLRGSRNTQRCEPQTYHFAFRLPNRFNNWWLDYGFVVHTEDHVRLFHIDGSENEYRSEAARSAAHVRTYFRSHAAEFCIASLHPFEGGTVVMPEDYGGPSVVFPD
jgi:hypothetical protein